MRQARLHLVPVQVGDQGLVSLLHRDAMDLANLLSIQCGARYSRYRKNDLIAAKRAFRVSRRIATLLLDVCQEFQHELGIELGQVELRWSQAQALGGKPHQQHQAVGIGLARVGTRRTIPREVLAQEVLR